MTLDEINAELAKLEVRVGELKRLKAEALSPFKRGDVIKWPTRKGMQRGEVLEMTMFLDDRPSWTVAIIYADGRYGKERSVSVFDKPVLDK